MISTRQMASLILEKLWTDPKNPAGFSGVSSLLKQANKFDSKITRHDVSKYLQTNHTYSLHKPRRLHYKREAYIASGLLTDLQVDLGDFQKLSLHNRGYRYILIGIDVLSRRVFLSETKSKTAKDMKDAFNRLFKKMEILPHRIYSDRGNEFISKEMKTYFKEKGVDQQWATNSVIKAGMAERGLRTVKQRLYRYFTRARTLNWVDVIAKFEHAINNSVCRATGMTPMQVTFKNAHNLWKKLYSHRLFKVNLIKSNFKVNDAVRIAKQKGLFDKGYLPTHSDEIYRIKSVKRGDPTTYRLMDEKGDQITSKYYHPEFSKTELNVNTPFRIEKVIRSRVKNGDKELYVKFYGIPIKEWIKESSVL